jgi:catechol 2,3-dioxygenase-like lactoylglutathione lyase family enzyme
MHPKSEGLLESSLYVDDVARAALFYEKIFGFRVISDFGERGCAMQAGERQVLLLFKKGGSRSIESPHDGDGELHVAFAVSASELRLGKHGWQKTESRLKRSVRGTWAAKASTFGIRTTRRAPQRQLLLSFDSASSSVTSTTAFVAGGTRRAEARASTDLASLLR